MSKIITHLANAEKPAKLHVGPTALRPGPMLLNVAATAVKFVIWSKLSSDTSSTETAKMNTTAMK